MGNTVLLWGAFTSWLFTILFKSWPSPVYVCAHTYNVYGSAVAECLLFSVSSFPVDFLNGSLEHAFRIHG